MNSVLLDDQPDDLIDQYFVAAHVGLNQSKTALMVSSQLWIFIPYTRGGRNKFIFSEASLVPPSLLILRRTIIFCSQLGFSDSGSSMD